MKFMVSIEHPAWAYQFAPVIADLLERGHKVQTLSINKDQCERVLQDKGIAFVSVAQTTGTNLVQKGWLFIWVTLRFLWLALRDRPDVFFGRASPMLAVVAFVLRRPHIIFEDTEAAAFSLMICRFCSTKIITPQYFSKNLGKKHLRITTFKEIFYLHPQRWQADRSVLRKYGLAENEKFFIVRFVAWNASHDFGLKGLSLGQKTELVQRLSQYGRVFISSEDALPAGLKAFELNIDFTDIHQFLYFATMYVGEGASMASEAAVLGTHAIYLNDLVAGSTLQQEQEFDVLYNMPPSKVAFSEILKKIETLLANESLSELGKQKREKILASCNDFAGHFSQVVLTQASGQEGEAIYG